jgi:hypothetical protein
VLGILKGRLGDSAMPKAMEQLVPQKIAKINEAAKTVQPSKYDKPEPKVQVAPAQKPTAKAGNPAKKPIAEEAKKAPPKANQFDEEVIGKK